MLGIDSPLGVRTDGRPFWSYFGGSEGAPEDGGAGDGDEEDGDEEDESGSAEERAARVALERSAKRAREESKNWRMLARELGVKTPEEIKALLVKKSTDDGKSVDVDKIVRETREEERAKTRRQIVGAAVEALAANGFADSEDAVKYVDLDDYEVDDDGRVDRNRIKADLADVLKRKPHLAKVSKRVDYEQGPRGKGPSNGADMNTLIRRAAGRA